MELFSWDRSGRGRLPFTAIAVVQSVAVWTAGGQRRGQQQPGAGQTDEQGNGGSKHRDRRGDHRFGLIELLSGTRAASSSLKQEVVESLDILIVRELTGGVYFGEPKEIIDLGNGQKRGIDTQVYDTFEIERISGVAFELARTRKNHVTSMEKRNVMKSGVLWNEVVTQTHKAKYSDVKLDHMLADAGGMQLVRWPKQFDVIVTDNLFGDMLSDVAAMLTGSLGMLPSASLGAPDPKTGSRKALYEPVHGSAPDIAGKGIANPIAMIASFAMCLRYSFGMVAEADRVEAAIAGVLDDGLRTRDIMSEGMTEVGTTAMGDAIIAKFLM